MKSLKILVAVWLPLTTLCVSTLKAETPLYLNADAPVEARVEDALSRMTLAEKVRVLHGQSTFSSAGVPRLGIPTLWTCDGPHGIRPEVLWDSWNQAGWTNDSITAFPALTALAATWDPSLARLYGESLGEEALYRGKNVVLGPSLNICRTPLNGRSFEYMGEDPLLTSRMAVNYIQGLQSRGVAACPKHYALNNQETRRHTTNVVVDDRALNEIYLPAFKAAATEGGAWAMMGAYNLYGDEHCCHNRRLLQDILKGQWGWEGCLISDWGGAYNTAQAAANGLDLEMGTGTNPASTSGRVAYDDFFLGSPYREMVAYGRADTAALNDKVRRVLRLMMRTSLRGHKGWGCVGGAHEEAARRIAAQSIVLLKNDGDMLPLNPEAKILVVGENGLKMMTVGGGSASLKARYEVTPLQGIRAVAPQTLYARGYVGDTTTVYNRVSTGQHLADDRTAEQLIDEAVKMARKADYVIFVGGLNKAPHQDCEGADRLDYALPYGQDAVIEALAKANPRLVVVNVSGNAVAMPWASKVPAIVQAWHNGSEAGNALADVLFGRVNPSGRLPMTWGKHLADYGSHALGERSYPGVPRLDGTEIYDEEYLDGLLVGYRWYDTKKIKPQWAFGHGLSYTTFQYGKPVLSAKELTADGQLTITVPVTNTGAREGAEVVQLYITEQAPVVLRPAKELKGFEKVMLQPGETRYVTFTITPAALQYYDDDTNRWTVRPGRFTAHVAAASDDIRASVPFIYK